MSYNTPMKHMSKVFITLILTVMVASFFAPSSSAQTNPLPLLTAEIEAGAEVATQSASTSGTIASPSAEVQQKKNEKKQNDITEDSSLETSKLVQFMNENPPGPLSWNNFLQHAIRSAVSNGVPASVIVLVLLFPLTAALIGASRHIIGLRGFGIYIPAVLSIALVSTGILEGLLIFGAIVTTALITKRFLAKTKIAYLPRTALLIWTISLGILALLLATPYFNLVTLMSVNIFPIMILVLLSENLLDALQRTKPADAAALTIETLSLAFISSLILQLESIRRFAVTEPELLVVAIAFVNVLVGKFTGLRLTEFLRFRSIIEEE